MKHAKTIEAIALGSALVVSISSTFLPLDVAAATACDNSTDGKGSTISGASDRFVKTNFIPRCSPNTVVKYLDAATAFAAQGGSLKGNTVYGSTTEGGGGAVWCGSSTLSTPLKASDVKDPTGSATDGCV
ncbi:MAG: hypothetical protein E6Q43_02625 [Dokdonella sp.]|nr:MAG: hypothetical protein E6Q43_02625 [Dokdonella sp.]